MSQTFLPLRKNHPSFMLLQVIIIARIFLYLSIQDKNLTQVLQFIFIYVVFSTGSANDTY
jgi:hypothetical protein